MDDKDYELQERLLSSDLSESEKTPSKKRSRYYRELCWSITANIILSTFLVFTLFLHFKPDELEMNDMLKRTSFYSPVLDQVKIPTFISQIDGGIAFSRKTSIARLHPGPEADAAWHRFEAIRTVPITEADIRAMGKNPATAARFPPEQWPDLGTEDVYMGQLDVVHQLHCLNQLRKRAFAAYANLGADAPQKPEWKWIHLEHCVSILLENLLCHADTELLTLNWIEEADYPFPDFNVNRQCRDFETVMRWQEEHAVDRERFINMTKPKDGVNVISGEQEWWDMFGEANDALQEVHHHG